MQANNDGGSHSTAHHHSFITPDLLSSDDFASTMRDIEDSTVPETAMTDIRIDETMRSEGNNQHQHLTLTISTQTPGVDMESRSPSSSAAYQTAMPSPTMPDFPSSRSRSNSQNYTEATSTPGKRSSAYFANSSDEDICNDPKRRRCESQEAEESQPQPQPAAFCNNDESLKRTSSRPLISRSRSHSLPDSSTLCRIVQGVLDLNPLNRASHGNILPSLSEAQAHFSSSSQRRSRDRPIPPPITRQSLRELETPEIMKNSQLIHDIIHDPTLQFRPNLEGPRGERKRQVSEQYWSALEREVDRLKVCLRKDPTGLVKLSSNRFPVLFTEMRDILCSLLPVNDKIVVEEVIDPDFLCQQLFRGVLDVSNLARFLGKTMKEHCAPMRDAMVEKMMRQFDYAGSSNDTAAFVLGLRMVFELLEGMKLDVANHQLRTMKKDLQDRAVVNEREYFDDRISKGKIDITPVIEWLRPAFESDSSFSAFTTAYIELLAPSSADVIPATFLFDIPRLNNFKKDFRDLISVQLCLLLYREFSMSMHPTSSSPSLQSFNNLRLEIWALLSELPESSKYAEASTSLAVQIALRATQHSQPTATVPASHLVTIAERWIHQNIVNTESKIFMLAQRRVVEYFEHHLVTTQEHCGAQTALRGCEEGKVVWALGTETAMWLLAERMHRVAAFHWAVFGEVYVRSVNVGV